MNMSTISCRNRLKFPVLMFVLVSAVYICCMQFRLETDQFLTPELISENVEAFQYEDRKYVIYHVDVTFDEANIICNQRSKPASLALPYTLNSAEFLAIALSETGIEVLLQSLLVKRQAEPISVGVDCSYLTLDREQHEYPQFVELDCKLKRPFICEEELANGRKPIAEAPISIG